jgi:hypothetical protein
MLKYVDAISPGVIQQATEKLVAQPTFGEKLSWWVQSPHAAERWLQFELAFWLQRVLGKAFAVLCELKWSDIVLIQMPASHPRLWKNTPAAALELKWYGNWCNKKYHLQKAAVDVEKVRKSRRPGAALVFLATVQPDPSVESHKWIEEDIKAGEGIRSPEEFLEKLDNEFFRIVQCHPDLRINPSVSHTGLLSSISIDVFGYYNLAARITP